MSDHGAGPFDLDDDEHLLAELGRALDRLDGPPSDALATAKAAFDVGRADAELAELVFDSLADEGLVAMRHEVVEARSLEFVVRGHRVDIELLDDALLGQVDPAQRVHVELETLEERVHADADDLGRFRFDAPRGLLRLHLTIDGDAAVVVTPWITW
jgi:hypothetical protein